MKIGNTDLNEDIFFIAEVGVNHEGDFNLAKQMIEEVATTGAQAVKFQTYYVSQNKYLSTSVDEVRYKRSIGYEFTAQQFAELAELANRKNLTFLSTPFDLDSVDMLDKLCPAFKIASGDLTFYPLIEKIASKGKPIILSTGMGTEEEIAFAISCIEENSPRELSETLVLLHCVSSYPCPPEAANLNSIQWLRDRFQVCTGYSDHTQGIKTSEIAVALGAKVIEKHFTYRKENQTFRDHAMSADKMDLKQLVNSTREIKTLLGEFKKDINELELENAITMRRSIAAFIDLKGGEVIRPEAITFLRPATGIPTNKVEQVVGKRVRHDVAKGSILKTEDLE